MAGERTLKLGTICTKIGSGATPRGGKEAYKGGATALIRSQNIYNDGFRREGLAFIDDFQAGQLANVEVQPNDVLLNITGDSVARCCQVASDVLPARVNQHVAIIRPKPDGLEPQFLRYVLVSDWMQNHLLSLASAGATRNALTKGMLEELEIQTPPLPTQRAIAHVLGTLDDLIELNRETNEILEEMARALFKSWFVDFDPVRAKLEGRPPAGMDAATAALFPDHFEDSELGQIPKGWEMGTLGDVCENVRRGVRPSEVDPETPYIGLEHMAKRSITLGEWDTAAKITSGKSAFQENEILFGKLRPYFHKVGVTAVNGVCSTDILVIRPKQADWFGFVLGHASSNALVQYADQSSAGTKMPRTNWKDLSSYKIVLPPPEIASTFTRLVDPQIASIRGSIHESRDLAALRDTLLPKLLSGELRVSELDAAAAAS